MKVLFLCKRHYTNRDLIDDSFGRLYHFPVMLTQMGHHCRVLAMDYRGKDESLLEYEGVGFYSLPISLAGIINYFSILKQQLDNWQPDIIFASGDSHIGAFGTWLARRNNIAVVFDVYDYYPVFGTNRLPGMKALFRYAISKSDLVITASQPLADRIGRKAKSLLVLENGVDAELFKPIDRDEVRKQLCIDNSKIVIGYFGAIAVSRGVDDLIDAVKQLYQEGINICLLLAGKLEKDQQLPNYGWIDYRGFIAQEMIPKYINACDVVVIPYRRDAQVDLSNACKIAEYLACSVPVITTRVSDYERFFKSCEEAVCEPDDIQSMAKAIKSQLENKCVETFPLDLSWGQLAGRLEGMLKQLVSKSQIKSS